MGDRVLMQVVSGEKFGPVIYCHNSGHDALEIIEKMSVRMKDRKGDLEYATARLLQAAIGDDKYDTGFGVWNIDRKLTKEDTHGDAGVILIDCENDFKKEILCGYHLGK